MSTQMSPENAKILRDAVATGAFASEESALSEAMKLLREKINESNGNGKVVPAEDVLREFDEWVSSHQSRNPNMDDSRESIYPDRT